MKRYKASATVCLLPTVRPANFCTCDHANIQCRALHLPGMYTQQCSLFVQMATEKPQTFTADETFPFCHACQGSFNQVSDNLAKIRKVLVQLQLWRSKWSTATCLVVASQPSIWNDMLTVHAIGWNQRKQEGLQHYPADTSRKAQRREDLSSVLRTL